MLRFNRSSFLLLALVLLPCGTLSAQELRLASGQRQTTLIELFTSQGCSSCPPAERWLSGLKADPRLWQEILPVAFHVDYWNYLGWPDTFSQAAFSERQRRYRSEGALSAVYTPGFVVNGKEWRRWRGLNRAPQSDKTVGTLSLSLDNHQLRANYLPSTGDTGSYTLSVAILGVGLRKVIARGENAGKTLPQDFAVLRFIQQRTNNGKWQIHLPSSAKLPGKRHALAAWVSRTDSQAPLQAVGGWLEQTPSPATTR